MSISIRGQSKKAKYMVVGIFTGGRRSRTDVAPPSTGATAGIPGTWTPPGSRPPATFVDLAQGRPVTVTPSPSTPWTSNQFVQTRQAGAAGRGTWSGIGWVGGMAPLAAPDSTWTKPDIVDWLLDNGVTFSEPALMRLSKAELLEIVADLLDDE